MRTSRWTTLRSLPQFARPHTFCRSATSIWRPPCQAQGFSNSNFRFLDADKPASDSKSPKDRNESSTIADVTDTEVHGPGSLPNGPNNGFGSSKSKDPNNYGSASNRARRNRSPKELPPVYIPDWLLERNVTLFEDIFAENPSFMAPAILTPTPFNKTIVDLTRPPLQSRIENEIKSDRNAAKTSEKDIDPGGATASKDNGNNNLSEGATSPGKAFKHPPQSNAKTETRASTQDLQTPSDVVKEVVRMLLGIVKHQFGDAHLSMKSHMILYCPKNGASRYLVEMVKQLSLTLGRFDFLRLDAQDIAEVGGNYMDNPETFEPDTLSSLGYDVSLVASQGQTQASKHNGEEEDFDEGDEDDFREESNKPSLSKPSLKSSLRRGSISVGMSIIPLDSLTGDFQEALKSLGNNGFSRSSPSLPSKPYVINAPQDVKDSTEDLKMGLLVETLLNAPERKIQAKGYTRLTFLQSSKGEFDADKHKLSDSLENTRPVSSLFIIFIEDYLQINTTANGSKFLDKIHEVVDAKRREGKRIVIIGTSSSREMMPNFSRSGVNNMQSAPSRGPMRTIVVPVSETTPNQVLVREHKSKIRAINLRHLRVMIRRLASPLDNVRVVTDNWSMEIDSKTAFLADLDELVWSMDHVNRVATHLLGIKRKNGLEVRHIERALTEIYNTDQAKYTWVRQEKDDEKKINKKPSKRERDIEERLRKLTSECNSHERKLLHGVIDVDSIRTTFDDIQAPQETINALKTLTSLSLVRPDAFTYGVLATDRIPGLLLYGPPGTGKTLLAKAVAKESGSTMLEVSGSDVYAMYVGEGEKNVRAIFSLAKKLSPCIIFIDEADAILGSRGSAHSRTSHRELINQFLREWDGMTDMNAFIMVATNRPFDLDEASLRRLPRRLLVDLPVERDREAILRIHLRDEIIDSEVSIPKLASETPFYSGSDLKNLCVAAALACVREEFDTAAEYNRKVKKDTPDAEKYKYAAKRTLCQRHFSKGMDEISASISEDMGSLNAIRKFDEKYGDRKGRRKKLGGYGFKTVDESESRGSDSARVRNQ